MPRAFPLPVVGAIKLTLSTVIPVPIFMYVDAVGVEVHLIRAAANEL